MYDFKNEPGGMLDQVCTVDDTVKNPNAGLGCQFYQASVGFMALSWYIPSPLNTKYSYHRLILHSIVPYYLLDSLLPSPLPSSHSLPMHR
jgi:hypothetical protein